MEELNRVEKVEYDIVIAGGGLAGLCCALSSARSGAKTALIQNRPVLGGNSSSEIRVVPGGSVHHNSWTMETGIIEELLLDDRVNNPVEFNDGAINSVYDLGLYQKALAEENLDLFLNTIVRDVVMSKKDASKRIEAVLAVQSGSEKEFIFHARQFVDCTGDGTLGYIAGAEYRYGRESREEYGEYLAPVTSDDVTQGSSINFYARNIGREVPFKAPDWAMKFNSDEEIGFRRNIGKIRPDRLSGFWWMEIANPFHQVSDYQEIQHQLLSHVLGVWDYYKNYSE